MTVPFIFGNQSGNVPANELDANFAFVSGVPIYAQDVGTANAYSCVFDPPLVGLVQGLPIFVKIANPNSGASTIDLGFGAVAIKRRDGSDLIGNELLTGQIAEFNSDGATLYLLGLATASDAIAIAGSDEQSAVTPAQLAAASVGTGYKGAWNASTNTPTLASSVGTLGDKYLVSVAGTTTLNGISSWAVNDTLLFNGSVWQRIPSTSTYAPAGTNPTGGGANANPSLKFLPWPLGSNDGTPGMQIGGTPGAVRQSGFGGATDTLFMQIQGEEICWINLAQTWGLGRYNRGGIINSVCWYPGAVKTSLNSFRFQNSDCDADFRTDGSLSQNILSSVAFHFQADAASGSPTISNLLFVPTGDGLNYIGTTLVQHSSSAGDIVANTTITGFNATTFTMADNAVNSRTDADFSINITAPSGNSSLGTYLTPLHIPFVGTLTAGSKTITSLKFNPQRVGIPTMGLITQTSDGGVDFPAGSRVAGYTQNTINLGDAVTGQPVNSAANRTATSISIDTGFSTLTGTGDLTLGSPIVTNVSFDPIATSLPVGTTVGGGFDRPQWEATSGVFTASTRVLSVTSTSITFTTNATVTHAALDVKIECSRTSIALSIMCSGVNLAALTGGWNASIGADVVQFPNILPVYYRSTKIIDTGGAWTGALKSYPAALVGTDAGSTDAYSVTLPNSVTHLDDMQIIVIRPNTSNTGGATLTIDSGSTTRNIKKVSAGSLVTLSNNNMVAAIPAVLVWNSPTSEFILQNPL